MGVYYFARLYSRTPCISFTYLYEDPSCADIKLASDHQLADYPGSSDLEIKEYDKDI